MAEPALRWLATLTRNGHVTHTTVFFPYTGGAAGGQPPTRALSPPPALPVPARKTRSRVQTSFPGGNVRREQVHAVLTRRRRPHRQGGRPPRPGRRPADARSLPRPPPSR